VTTLQGALADLEDNGKHRVTALEQSCRQVMDKMAATKDKACAAISHRADKSSEKVRVKKYRVRLSVDVMIHL
jgi:hypothetical protein